MERELHVRLYVIEDGANSMLRPLRNCVQISQRRFNIPSYRSESRIVECSDCRRHVVHELVVDEGLHNALAIDAKGDIVLKKRRAGEVYPADPFPNLFLIRGELTDVSDHRDRVEHIVPLSSDEVV